MSRRHVDSKYSWCPGPIMGFGKDGKLSILYDFGDNLDVSALPAKDVAGGGGRYNNLLIDDFRMIKLSYTAYLEGGETGDQVVFGLASSDLSSAEIEECLESAWFEESDRIQQERSSRPVWLLGRVSVLAGDHPVPFDGAFRAETIRWTFHQASGWQWWAFNPSTGSAIGSAATLTFLSKIFGVWVR